MPKNTVQQKAISAALKGNWELALKLNKEIVKEDKGNVDALNRLARTHAELGDIKKAKFFSKKVLKIDPLNQIASKSLDKWKVLKASNDTEKKGATISSNMFLEEPGKTKIIKLLHIGDENFLASIDAGDEVQISCKKHRVSILTKDNRYVGRLPDDIAARIRNLIKIGNEYVALVKKVDSKEVLIFMKEINRSPKMKDVPTFSTEKAGYVSFIPH